MLLMRATITDFAWPIILLWNRRGRFIIIYNNKLYNTYYRVVSQKYNYITAPTRVSHYPFNHYNIIMYVFIFIATAVVVPRLRLLPTSLTSSLVFDNIAWCRRSVSSAARVSHYRSSRIASFTSIGRSCTKIIKSLEFLFSRTFYRSFPSHLRCLTPTCPTVSSVWTESTTKS